MKNPALVGVDVGTTRTKCLIIDATGEMLALASAPTVEFHPRPDWTDYDGDAIWQCVCETIRAALCQMEDPSRIQAIAVASVVLVAKPSWIEPGSEIAMLSSRLWLIDGFAFDDCNIPIVFNDGEYTCAARVIVLIDDLLVKGG